MSNESEYQAKLKKLKLPETYDEIPEKYINSLYDIYVRGGNVVIDENRDKKIKIILKILNKILKISGKEPIENITDFEASREDMINIKCQEYFESKYDFVFEVFDKYKHKYYTRKQINIYIMSFLKSGIKEVGYNLSHRQNVNFRKVGGKQETITTTTYFIE